MQKNDKSTAKKRRLMSERMLSAIPAIQSYMADGMKHSQACIKAGFSGGGTRAIIKKHMVENNLLPKRGASSNAAPEVKEEKVHDEFDEKIFRERIESYSVNDKSYKGSKETFVFTCAYNDVEVDEKFLDALVTYCTVKDAELFIVPTRYANPTNSASAASSKNMTWDPRIKKYVCKDEIDFGKFRFLANLNINATSSNPTGSFHSIARGDTIIIPHARLQSEVLPSLSNVDPTIICTTGAITKPCYSDSKAGYAANFAHTNSACVVERDGEFYHLRHLEWDGKGFYDIGKYFTGNWIEEHVDAVSAMSMGDMHARFLDPKVEYATFTAPDSMVNELKPGIGIYEDLMDFYSASHHHNHMPYTQYAKHLSGDDSIEAELNLTLSKLGRFKREIIKSSNHPEHFKKWLENADIRHDHVNKKLFHLMNYLVLDETTMGESGAESPNPFELYARMYLPDSVLENITFLSRSESCVICGIEVSNHGDIGANGSRGSRAQYARFPEKTNIGHSHSPGISGGCYQVGTSSRMRMEYNVGPSSWLQTHCLIYKNGCRQLINIIGGKWRR